MKFSADEILETNIDRVWASLTDFAVFERAARKRGVDMKRLAGPSELGLGSAWDTRLTYKGRELEARTEIIACDAPQLLEFESTVRGVVALNRIDLSELDGGRTNLSMSLGLTPRTFAGRLLLQSLRVGRSAFERRFKKRFGKFARYLETL